MKIVFLSGGARERALRYMLEQGEKVCGVITPHLSERNSRFKDVITTAVEFNVPVYQVRRDGLQDVLSLLEPDILVSCGFPYIVDAAVISSVRYAVNVHPTLLPKYRGYRSGAYILINGEKETGVTVHFLTEEMDRGGIILQRKVSLSVFDTPKSMNRKCQQIEPKALYDAIQILKSGKIVATKQDESKASEYLKLRTPEDSQIDPSRPLFELYNEIRACDPDDYPAFFMLEGQKVLIRLWRTSRPDNEGDDTI